MHIISSNSDLKKLNSHQPNLTTIQNIFNSIFQSNTSASPLYNPDADGYLVLIEATDLDQPLNEIGITFKLVEIPFEGVTKIDDFFHAVYLPNNQYALSFLIPDEPWIDGPLREVLKSYLDE